MIRGKFPNTVEVQSNMTANKFAPRPTIIGVAPLKIGSAPEPTRSLTPTGRYRLKVPAVEVVTPVKRGPR